MWAFREFSLVAFAAILALNLVEAAKVPPEEVQFQVVEEQQQQQPQEKVPKVVSTTGENDEEPLPESFRKKNIKNRSELRHLRARLRAADNPLPMERIARFFLDFATSDEVNSDNSYNSGFTFGSGFGSGSGKTSNLFNLNIDSNEIYEGIFKPENVAIQIGQNAFNFAATSVAWALAGALYRSGSTSGRGYGVPSATDAYSTPITTTSSYGAPISSPISSSYGSPVSSPISGISSPLTFIHDKISDKINKIKDVFSGNANQDDGYGKSSDGSTVIYTKTPKTTSGTFVPPGYTRHPAGHLVPIYRNPDVVYKAQPGSVGRTALADEMDEEDEDEELNDLSVEDIQVLLDNEKMHPGVLQGLTPEQKYKMYARAKSALMEAQQEEMMQLRLQQEQQQQQQELALAERRSTVGKLPIEKAGMIRGPEIKIAGETGGVRTKVAGVRKRRKLVRKQPQQKQQQQYPMN